MTGREIENKIHKLQSSQKGGEGIAKVLILFWFQMELFFFLNTFKSELRFLPIQLYSYFLYSVLDREPNGLKGK